MPMRAINTGPVVSSDPAALVRARMREKRLYEARFLFRQLAGDIDESERESLQGELSRLCAQIEQMRARAREHTGRGERDRAEKLYGDIAEIAIDVPGLVEEKQAFAGTDSYVAQITGQELAPGLSASPVETNVAAVDGDSSEAPAVVGPCKTVTRAYHRVRVYWMYGIGLTIVALLLLVRLLFHSSPRQDIHHVDAAIQAAQQIVIRPIVSSSADTPDGDAVKEAQSDHSTTETPSSSVFKLGTLQIKDSSPETGDKVIAR